MCWEGWQGQGSLAWFMPLISDAASTFIQSRELGRLRGMEGLQGIRDKGETLRNISLIQQCEDRLQTQGMGLGCSCIFPPIAFAGGCGGDG